MKKFYRLILFVLLITYADFLSAQILNQVNLNQKPIPGTCIDKSCSTVQPKVGSFANAYTQTQCGLNYAISGVKLTQRATWQPGVGQPATMNISTIPPCVVPANGHILRAYVYWIVEGGPATGSVNLTNPLGVTQNFTGTLIGNVSGGKCWSCSDTRHFRADVTSHITGNGNYTISGLPQSTSCGDTDGAVLIIIYRDPSATYQGTMVLHDGIILVNGGSQNHTLTGFTACGPTTNATAFTVAGDLQNNAFDTHTITMNGGSAVVTPNFFNLDIRNVTVTSGQSSSLFGISSSGDCWSWICAGLYFQTTTCVTCTPSGTIATPGAVSGPTTLCAGQTATYSVGTVTGATSYNWTVPSGWTINSGQGTTSISVTAGSTSGNVCVTASNSCGTSSPSCTNVTINTAPPQPGPITGNSSVCSGQTLTYSISSVTGATSYNWTVPSGWTINSGQGTTSISVTTSGSTGNVCVTASNACGTSPAQCLAITVGAAPASPGAITGSNPICPNTTNSYSIATVTGATSYTWTVPAGWVINSGQGTTTISTTSGTSGGNICVTASNGCGTSASQCTNITMNNTSTAPTSATANPSTICMGNSTTLTVNGGSLGTGAQWQWFSGSCGGTAVGTGASITVSPTTTTTYFVRASGACNNTTCASVTVTVDLNPATSNAGPNQSVCGLTTTLSGNTPSLGTGTWTQVSGPGTITFANINSPTSSATASTFGTYVLQWTINNGTCSTSSTVSITFSEMPIPAAAGNDAAVCGLTINLNGNTPNVGSGAWAMVSGSGTITFSNVSSATSSATASVYGTYTLSWTFTNGACSNSDNVDITFDEMPNTADAGLDDAICGLTLSLNANTANIGTANWSQLSGPGTLTFSNSSSNSSSVTASAYGTYSASWTIVNGVCSTTDNVSLTFDEMPNAANAGADDSICGLITNLAGTQANIGVSTWSQISGPGTTTFNNPNQHNSGINVSTSGLYEYALTIVNGTCVTSDTVSYHFFDAPTPVDAGADTAVCALNLNLNAQTSSLGNGIWSQVSGPVTATISNPTNINTLFDATQYGNYTLVWTVVNGACTLYDTVNVRLDQTPSIAYAGIDTTICTNDYILEANIPAIGNGVWSTTTGGIVMSDSTANMNFISSLAVGVNTLIWTISNGVCPSSSDTLEITVNPSSIIPDFTTDTNEIYAYQIVKFIDLSTGNPDTWYWNFGDGDTSKIQNPGHIYTDIGIYPVMLVITNALGCRDTIIKDIEVKERFLVPNIFTPNNDGINDVFKVIASGYKDFSIQIYNRFGQLIFESLSPTIGWNGKTASGLDVTVGTYFYIIKAVAPDGKEVIEKGPLQLLR